LQTRDEDRAKGLTHALSDNFLAVELPGSFGANRMLGVVVDGLSASGLRAVA
jgi:hypothetical protein